MTCIAGLVEVNGRVWIGGDSAGSNQYQLTVRRDPKVFRIGDILFGTAGSFRMAQLLRCAFMPPPHPDGMDTERYLVKVFIDAVRQLFKDAGAAKAVNDQEQGNYFLLGYRRQLWRVEPDYQVGQALEGYDAVGTGAEVAFGALYVLQHGGAPSLTPRDKIRLTLEAAEQWQPAVRRPFTIDALEPEQA